jgi:hypothetical protein
VSSLTLRLLASLPIALIVGTFAANAPAEERSCGRLVVEADAELTARVREAIEGRDDVDSCARVKVTKVNGATIVKVVLPDGRSTSRSVSRREDVAPTVQALLLVPRVAPREPDPAEEGPPAPAEETPTPAVAVAVAPATPLVSPPDERPRSFEAPPRVPTTHASHVRVELSVLSAARIGYEQMGLSLGALSFVDVDGWLAGFTGRADYLQEMDVGPPDASFSLALLGGRRFRMRSVALDLYGGPGVALQGTYTSVTENPRIGRRVEERSPGAQPRVLAGARINFRAQSMFRMFIGIDADVGARGEGVRRGELLGPREGSQRLPLWTVGLALGATVGTL